MDFTEETKNPLVKFWQKSRQNKLIIIAIGLFIFFTIILFSLPGQKSFEEGYRKALKTTSNPSSSPTTSSPTPSPTPTGKGAAKQISACPTKTTSTYTVAKCVVLLDDKNKQYNDLYVVINPLLRFQKDKVQALANTIRTNECPKSCLINIWDDVDSANLAFTLDLLSEADQKKWEQDHASFIAIGGGLEMHFIATFDTDGNKFDYMVEPPKERKIVKGSTPKGVEFYEKVEALRKQGRVNGELCTEYESDPVVDVNPDGPSVQLSLMYPTITGNVDSSDKILILNDFKVIKALAEQDSSLVLPDYGTLRLFVLTFHDNSCIAKGELEQLMIDDQPKWMDWK